MSVPYWQAREFAVQADVGVDTMRAVLAGVDATKSRARARAHKWLREHGYASLAAPAPETAMPSPRKLASQRLRERWADPAYRQQMREQARRNSPRGPAAKLTGAIVQEARAAYATGATTVRALAAKYGVHRATMADAIAGRTWK